MPRKNAPPFLKGGALNPQGEGETTFDLGVVSTQHPSGESQEKRVLEKLLDARKHERREVEGCDRAFRAFREGTACVARVLLGVPVNNGGGLVIDF